jgi:DNA-binding GntR family transcriptional regulator
MPRLSVATTSKRDHAYHGLRRLLVLQQLKPGERIREPQWAQRLGVHRSALREAFVRLEAEGLIERGERTGYFVPELSEQDMQEITKLRLALECLAIEEICSSPQPVSLEPMQRVVKELEQFVRREYSLGTLEADRRFHEELIDLAGSRRLSALYHRAPLPLIHNDTQDKTAWREAAERTLREHRQILAALRDRNASKATNLLRNHLGHHPVLPICR